MTTKPDDWSRRPPPGAPARTTTLARLLAATAAELRAQQPPADLRARVAASARTPLRAARAAAAAPPEPATGRRTAATVPPARPRWWAWSGAAACAGVLAGSMLLMLRSPLPQAADEGLRIGSFVPLVEPERWPRDASPAWLVATELPADRLAAMGLPYDPARAGASVRAELLLRPSGEVLAVRFLP